MNMKIAELSKRALDYAENNQSEYISEHWFKLYTERLYESIIGECIQTIQETMSRDGRDTPQWKQSQLHIEKIKEHFGVEDR